ncbi:hypothetical protein [Streptomyces noursei]|uniref:hypothetical protein n=1 Tax=Streptomyces noursei TaxID=1971 RepID=UPI00045F0CE6|nr:hypothetical protein [Streptomyces noursei]AIA00613.1 hypothetical protein DC74_85 [Streptomyces noursei]
MSAGRRVLRLLEGACAAVAVLYATLLVLFSNYDALLVTYRNGKLTSTIVILAVACVGWLGLRLVRSPRCPAVGLLVGGACVVGLLAVLRWTPRPSVEVGHVTPTPGTGGFWEPRPSDSTPGTAPPPARPTSGP